MAGPTHLEKLLPEMRAYARAITAGSDSAEDLVQDAIERSLRHDDRPERLERLRPWLFCVIRNLHYDELRRLRVRREFQSREKRLSLESGADTDTGRDVLIRLAFERLPAEKREILFLVDVIGLEYAEAADVIGIPKGTVMSRVSRARRALRVAVEGTPQLRTDTAGGRQG